MGFELVSEYSPMGDQGQAIEKLVKSIEAGNRHQTLMGVTGSGKTFTMANVIERIGRPTLIMSHNKTLAAQLYSEFKNFFPNNAVEYFVSYFDYYQPEAYLPRTDTYIEKDSSINEEIERLRLSTMGSLLTRPDTIVVASVSCIYGLGSPEDYEGMMVPVWQGQQLGRDEFLKSLVDILFERNDIGFGRGNFRVRGDVVEVHPAYLDTTAIRVEFFGDEVDRVSSIDVVSGTVMERIDKHTFFPAKQFVTSSEKMRVARIAIRAEMEERVAWFEKNDKLIEAQRLKMRTDYDLEMMEEMGFCQGIENYSRHLTGREPGAMPYTLLDFFPDDFLLMVDESHVSLPQVRGMYEGDRSRKSVLVDHGFRLSSAMDNRPLKYAEYMKQTGQRMYVSATPGPFEIVNSRPENTSFIPVHGDKGKGDRADPAAAVEVRGERGVGGTRRVRCGGPGEGADRGAGDPADGIAGPGGAAASAGGADRRDDRVVPEAGGTSGTRAGDDADEADCGGSDGLPEGRGAEGALHPCRRGRGGAGRNSPGPAGGGVRHPGWHQSFAGGPGPAGGLAGLCAGRGQGGVFAERDQPDPDRGSGGASFERRVCVVLR